MTDKELGNPENESFDGKPEETNLEKNEIIENEVESETVPTELHEDDFIVNEPILDDSESLNTEEKSVLLHNQDNQNPSDIAAVVPPANNNSKLWMGISLLLAIVLVVVLIKPPFNSSGDNEAVATVNGVDIKKDTLYNELVTLGGTQTMDNLITEELIEQEVTKAKITVSEEDVTKELESVKKNFATEAEFEAALTQSGMTLDNLKEEMKVQVKIRKLVEPQVKVTDEDIKTYFDSNAGAFDTAEEVRASHIVVATKEEAESILKELKGGADFATIAAEKSTDTNTKDLGGDMNFFSRGVTGDEAFEEAAFALEKDQLSGVVETASGFHIIKVTDRKDAHTATLEESKVEIKELLTNQQVSTLSTTWLAELKKNADIKNTLEKEVDATVPTTETTETVK